MNKNSLTLEKLIEISKQESYRMPSNLTREERRKWVLQNFKNKSCNKTKTKLQ